MKKHQIIKKLLLYIISIAIVSTVFIVVFTEKRSETKYKARDYDEILESEVINAVTEYNAVSFFSDGDSISGFDYELLNEFARAKGIKANIVPEMSFEKRLNDVSRGKYDMIAISTPTTANLKDSLLFTHTLLIGKQILVQRKEDKTNKSDSAYVHINSQLDLAGKTIHLIKDSPAVMRIKNLMAEIADTIYIKEISEYGPEQLLAMVSGGDIDYAVCDENIAKVYISDFPNLDIDTDISFNLFYSWGVSKRAPKLLDSLNVWLDSYIKTKEYKKLYNKYFNKK